MSRCSNDYEILRSDSKGLFDKGLSLKKEGKYKEAIIFFNKAIELNPKNLKALNYRGLAYCKLHRYKEAIIDFEHALKIETKEKEEYATTYNNKGLALYYYARDYYLTKPTQRKDDDNSSLYEQGRKCLYNDAASYFDKAIEKNPQNIDAWNNKGITMSALGLKEEAIRCFNKAIELNPKKPKAWNNLGRSLSNSEKYEEAINYYDKAISLIHYDEDKDPTYTDALTNKGIAFTKLGKYTRYSKCYEDAADCFEKVLDIDPDNVNALNHKAMLYLEQGDNTRAEEIIEESLRIQMKHHDDAGQYYWNIVETLDKKAIILIHLEKYKDAMKCLEEAKKYDPEYGAIYVHMGYIKFKDKKYDDAIYYFDEAITRSPRFAEAHGAKALALYKKGDHSSAIREARSTIGIKPSLAVADENLSKLPSHDTDTSYSQTFWDFWTMSPIKKMVAIILVFLGIGIIGYYFYMLNLHYSQDVIKSFEIPNSYLILVGIILFVLLVPQINKAKIGSLLEFEFQPHYHPTSEPPSLSESTIGLS